MLRLRLLLIISFGFVPVSSHAQAAAATSDVERVSLHQSAEWMDVATHLPDPATASPAELETAGDVLGARRFPEDALDYYGYALARGGKLSVLLNKMGVVRLELGDVPIAQQLFQRVVREDKRNAIAWNNLGATEFMNKKYSQALADYRRAASLDKNSAVFHANLGLAYFELADMDDMRSQFRSALALDPEIFTSQTTGGSAARLLATGDYPKLCFEMARLYAKSGNLPAMRLWLGKSSEAGFDVATEMRMDPILSGFSKDPEVAMLLRNAQSLRKQNVLAAVKRAPALGVPSPSSSEPAPPPSPDAQVPGSKLL